MAAKERSEGRLERSRGLVALRHGIGAAVLVGLVVSGCGGPAASTSGPAATQSDGATAAPSPGASGSTPAPTDGAPDSEANADPSQPSGPPAPPLPNPVTTPIGKAVREGAPPQPSVKAATEVSPFSETVSYGDGVTLKITSARGAVESGHGPGVFAGREFVDFDVEVTNGSSTPLDLSQVVVTVHYGDSKQIAAPVYTPSAETADFAGVLAPGGGKATASYGFAVPKSELGNVTMVVDFDGAHASAVFSGTVGTS